MTCDNCGQMMCGGVTEWHFECRNCGLEQSLLKPLDLSIDDAVVDEISREAGLEAIRKASFSTTVDVLKKFISAGTLLDVGCAHGWFLDVGRAAGFTCMGLEPSPQVAASAISRGHRVITGYFPDALGDERNFSVVSFNDVFEHIPGPRKTLAAVGDLLITKGILSVAIPSRNGFFYRLSRFMVRFGLTGPFERMWQKGFSSPHLYYFSSDVLTSLAKDAGLDVVYRGHLPSVRLSGLWDRLTLDRRSSAWRNSALYVGVALFIPFLSLFPADIDLLVFRKAGGPSIGSP